jgi:hypothetical protein
MGEDGSRAVRPEHDAGVPSTASTETPQAPDEPVGGFETGNDPTGGATWVRRRIRLSAPAGAAEAMDEILELPGIARASIEHDDPPELVLDMEPGVLSDDELVAGIARAGLDVAGWHDEPVP